MRFLELFSNREIAFIFWAFVSLIFIFKSKPIRQSLANLFKALFAKQILILLLLMLSYIALLLAILMHFHLWNFSLSKEAIYWIFGTGFILIMNALSRTDKNYIRKILLENLKLLVILEFLINFYTFPLLVELVLIPLLFIIFAMGAFVEEKKEYQLIKKIIDWIKMLFGASIIISILIKTINGYGNLVTLDNIRTLLLPPLLTILYIPFLYFFMLYATYEEIFLRISLFLRENPDLIKHTKRAVLHTNHLNLIKLQAFSRYSASLFVRVNDKKDVEQIIDGFKKIHSHAL